MNSFRRLVTAFGVLLSAAAAWAQSGTVTASLQDESGEPLSFATVSLTKAGESKVYKYALSSESGKVKIEGVRAGSYKLKVELMGYQNIEQTVQVKGNTDLGVLKAKEDKEVLNAASVSAVGNPIVIKKDTVEYNADAFKTAENDVLEDLLKKLPGVEVTSEGSITYNGETINKITIDGKTFFLDDPQLASKNLPAKIIQKVKVIEKKSEQAQFTGIDDGQEETVIDLSVRPGMMKGTFGNINVGAGHDLPSTDSPYDDWRYQGAAFLGKFSDHQQLSVIVNGNNTNNRGFNDLSGNMMGGMRGGGGGMGRGGGGWGQGNGIITSYMAGVNGAWDLFDNRMNLGGNYLFNGTETDVEERSRKTTYLNGRDYDLDYSGAGLSSTNTYGNRFGMRLEHKFNDNTSILFEPQLNFGHGNFNEFSQDTTWRSDRSIDDPLNRSVTNTLGSNRNISTSGWLLLRQRLGKPGRTLTAMVRYSFSNNDLDGFNLSDTRSYDSGMERDSVINQRYEQNQRSSSVSTRLTYTEPISKYFYLEANYSIGIGRSSSYKDTYDSAYDRMDAGGIAPAFGYDGRGVPLYQNSGLVSNEIFNPTYSNKIVNKYTNQSVGGNILFQNGTVRAQLGASWRPTTTDNETTRGGVPTPYHSYVHPWSPQASLWYEISESSNIHFFYFGESQQPSVSKLMPVPDNTDPLNVSFGNPTLRPSFNHNLRGGFRYSNKKKFSSVNGFMRATYSQSPVVSTKWYGSNGASYSMPYNGPASLSVNLNMFVNLPLKNKNFTFSNMSRINYSNSSSYVGKNIEMDSFYKDGEMDYEAFLAKYPDPGRDDSFDRSKVETLGVTERVRLSYRTDNLDADVSARTRYSQSWYTIGNGTTTWNNQLSSSLVWKIPSPGIQFKGEFNYNWYNGYSIPQPDEYVFNMEVIKNLFKDKVMLSVKGYDIFDQAKNLTVKDTENYHEEVWNNTLGRYIILSLTYRFGTFDRSKMRGPGGRPMGGRPMGGGPGGR